MCWEYTRKFRGDHSLWLFSTEPEGVLLIKPKSELLKDHDEHRKTFLNILREKNPEIRLRSVGKIFGGGLKIVASTEEDVSFIRNVFTDHGDRDLLENFDLIIPNKRFPQLILYNVDKDVKLETLQTGLLAKNIFLANSMNKPHFKIEFSIPAKDRSKNHWVFSINPKKFEEIKEKAGLYFEFTRLRTSEFISVRQCRKCFAFGHTTKKCDPKTKQRWLFSRTSYYYIQASNHPFMQRSFYQ
ncbi:hypothetical protein AVEN_226632-1 [Araneus ventricosus]|uniref:CCHC-type domain-containing protein n=1 Tax=Araneus ventricosus TaxID=182803 RepID=A0A4Y2TXL7_ARAVE|nr:hypothetical protein AVEN_226632-1 [Araneus ventricosus]